MKKIIRLTESDLARIVKRVVKENEEDNDFSSPEDYGSEMERRRTSRQEEKLKKHSRNNDEMFDMEMRRLKRELHGIKTLTDDPERLNHTIDMLLNVSLPKLQEFR